MEQDYERDLHIDETALDLEWLGQPTLMMRYAHQLADAEREVAIIKEAISIKEAELDRDIRTDPTEFDLKDIKITEAVVTNAIKMQESMKKIHAKLIDAQYEVRMLKGAVDAIQGRKDALQDLVKLHGQQYFAGPRVPRDITFEVKQRHQQQQANKTIKIRKRKT